MGFGRPNDSPDPATFTSAASVESVPGPARLNLRPPPKDACQPLSWLASLSVPERCSP